MTSVLFTSTNEQRNKNENYKMNLNSKFILINLVGGREVRGLLKRLAVSVSLLIE